MSFAHALRRMDNFSHFTEEQMEQMAGCVSQSKFPAGATVIEEGDSTFDAYVIESGAVKIRRQTLIGEFVLARLGAGALFGETSFVDREGRSGDAVTEVESRLLVLNPMALGALMEQDQKFTLALYWALWKSLSGKLRDTNDLLARFFAEGAEPPSREEPSPKDTSGEFRVDMEAKRTVFQEQRLSSLEINFLASLSREEKFGPGENIFREGDAGEEMYVVLDGRVRISKYIPGAGEEALALLARGEFFGEMALIDRKPRSADAMAHEGGAVVLAIPRDVVEGILSIHKVSSVRLLKLLCGLIAKRLREVDEKIVGWFLLAGGHAPGQEPDDRG